METKTSVQQHEDRSIVNLILGILSVLLSLLPIINLGGLLSGILALVRGKSNKRFAFDQQLAESGMNIAGRITGIAGIVLSSLSLIAYFVLFVFVLRFLGNLSGDLFNSLLQYLD